jgi:outer membrane protein assembly factor BamB
MRIYRLAWSCLLVALSACKAASGTDAGDGPRSAWSSAPAVAGGDWVGGTPAVDGGRVFVQEAYNLVALDAASGARVWTRRIRVAAAPPPTTLLASQGRVFVSETDSVMAIDAATGSTVWSMHPDSQTVTVPALDSDALYTGQRGIPIVYALGRADGAVRWKVNVGPGFTYPAHVRGVAVSGDTVYAAVERYLNLNGADASGVLVALDRRDGRELWRHETAASATRHYFLGAPVVAGNLVLVADFGSGDVVAIRSANQEVAWRTFAGGVDRLVARTSVVYSAGVDHQARAFDLVTGAVRWSQDTGSSAFGVGVCGNSLLVSAFELRRFDLASGQSTGQAASANHDGGFVTNIVSDGTRAYVSGTSGVYAYWCD